MPEASPSSTASNEPPLTVEVVIQNTFRDTIGKDSPTFASAEIEPDLWQAWFLQWLIALQTDLSNTHAYELSVRLTDDTGIQALNHQYRHKNQPTDVLAFASLEVDYPQPKEELDFPLYLGDLVISVETAQRQAQERGHDLVQELAWLASHGLLHLLGWDHPDEASLEEMLHQQEGLLQIVGFSLKFDQSEL